MKKIENTGQFKREAKGIHRKTLASDLEAVLKLLIADETFSAKYFDHPLVGEWKDHRDCHIKPDLVLIYRIPNEDTLQLVRLGSHSELGI